MNYIVFNKDGSIKNLNLPDIIVQGNNGVNEIYVAVEDYSNDAYTATAYFVLPNEDSNNISAIVSSFQVDDSTYQGYKVVLTSAQTALAGHVLMSLRLEGTNIAWTYNVILTINKSGYAPSLTQITMSQYENIISSLATFQPKYTLNNARFYASLEAAQEDIENLAINQMFIVANPSTPSVYPKLYFKQNATTLTELNTLGQFNSPSVTVNTTTLAAGSTATGSGTATATGNNWSLTFNLGIPKGDKGDKGDTGAAGADGTYVAYNLGTYQNGSFSMLCGFARTYFSTDRPYGQTCYGVYSTNGSDYYCWFIRSYYNTLICLRNQQIFYCFYNLTTQTWSWKSIGFTQEYTSNPTSFTSLIPGFYSIEYTPSGSNVPCTVTMSVRDTTKTTRSCLGHTNSGLEWEAVFVPTEGIKIYEDGSIVSSPTATLTLIAEYMRGTN